jgi:hypothetical protein
MTRPYRVGMQRPNQRYISPDEIYDDMPSSAPVEMPRQFPFSWNPVNGLGARPRELGGNLRLTIDHDVNGLGSVTSDFLNLVQNVGSGVVNAGGGAAKDKASSEIESFLRSSAAAPMLKAVEEKAAEGVTKVVKKQAPNLMLLAVAGGAVGGAVSAKLGKIGTIGALLVALYAAREILKAGENPK